MCKKAEQLKMNPSTASGRLVKDIIFGFLVKEKIVCHHCDRPMTRENYSIEHKEPWLDSENPVGLYFDLENISFSHLRCNIKASRNNMTSKQKHPSISAYENRGCRCAECTELKRIHNKKYRKPLLT